MGRSPLPRPPVVFDGTLVRIPLTRGYTTVVDLRDWPRVAPYTWYTTRESYPYAVTKQGGHRTPLLMHRVILDAPRHLLVDHIDFDTLNNRRANLRLVTAAENTAHQQLQGGQSRFRGVRWFKGKWQAAIMVRGQWVYAGRFTDEEEAARAVDAALVKAWGHYATPNFPV